MYNLLTRTSEYELNVISLLSLGYLFKMVTSKYLFSTNN